MGNSEILNYKSLQKNEDFYTDIVSGLSRTPKQLPSKYFYDETGDRLFQQLMSNPEYYLTECEMEIFSCQTKQLAVSITKHHTKFDLIELGPGDCSKSIYLIKELLEQKVDFAFTPIDISKNIIDKIKETFPLELPLLKLSPLNGEYFEMLEKANLKSGVPKVILFLGSNIGNMSSDDCEFFCKRMRSNMRVGDIAIIGFDLKKNPRIIRAAYDDRKGDTRKFNLNLLDRINRELGGDFKTTDFEHYCTYDPQSGACKSYLICLKDLDVHIGDETFPFKRDEFIWMEISQKYALSEIEQLANKTGFILNNNLLDARGWFADSIWMAT